MPLLHEAISPYATRRTSLRIDLTDDGSQTGHGQPSRNSLPKIRRAIRGQKFEFNCGETAASDAGMRAARGKYVMTMDADLQNDPKDIPAFLAALAQRRRRLRLRHARCDAIARATISSASHHRASPTGCATSSADENITDAGCTYRCFKRECVDKIKLYRGLHRFIPTLLKMEGYRVVEIPVSNNPRLHGESKYGVWNRLFKSFPGPACDPLDEVAGAGVSDRGEPGSLAGAADRTVAVPGGRNW